MAVPFYNQGDQNIYAGGEHFIPQEKYRLNYTPSTMLASTVGNTGGVTGTGAAYPYYAPGGGGGGSFNPNQLIEDFYSNTANRQKRLENPNWLGTQLNNLGLGQRSVKEMMNPPTGNYSRSIGDTINFGLDVLPGQGQYGNMPGVIEGDVRKTAGLPFGIGSMISKIMPDKYYDMDPGNQAFIQSQMGYSGPTVFGDNTMGNKDPFGINVRSAFGDYGAYTDKMADPEGALAALVAQQEEEGKTNTIQMRKLNFYKNLARKKSIINRNVATQRKMRDAWEAETGREMDAADTAFARTGDYDEYSGAGGTPSYSIPSGTYSYEGSDEQDKDNEGASNTGGSKGSMPTGTEGRNPWGRAQGGRVGLYRGGDPEEPAENIFEFMQDQGIPGGEMVSDEWNDRLLEQLYNKFINQGFSPADAEKMAMQEFDLMAAGPEQDQGIGSLI
tara:strand:- start:1067 stop:2395 length:1329 start_codon:yes stop_codon:yes gene_type:complete